MRSNCRRGAAVRYAPGKPTGRDQTALLVLALFVGQALAHAGTPDNLGCAASNPAFPNPTIAFFVCHYPVNDRYVPPGFDTVYPVGILVPTANGKYPIVMNWDGYGSQTNCPTWDKSSTSAIVVKSCPDYYPRADLYQVGGISPWGFGGPFFGNSPAERYAAAVRQVDALWGDKVDTGAGLLLQGNSYGASTSLLQPLLLDSDIHSRITKVNAAEAVLGFVDAGGLYEKTPNVRLAWGNTPLALLDHAAQAERLKFIYLFIQGSPADTVVPFHQDWFQQVCDTHKIACYGLWHNCGHALPAPSCAAALPYNTMFAASGQNVRLDDPFLVVFTEADSNRWGAQGGYNIGLSWKNLSATESMAQADLRYLALTNIAPIEPQPAASHLLVTLRMRPEGALSLAYGDIVEWTLEGETGQAIVLVPGEITVPVTLQSNTTYSTFTLTKTGHIPGC